MGTEREKVAEQLRNMRFLGEYGFAESLPDDYVEKITSFIIARDKERSESEQCWQKTS